MPRRSALDCDMPRAAASRRSRAVSLRLLALCVASLAARVGGQASAQPSAPPTSGSVSLALLITGLSSYNATTGAALQAAVAAVANGGLAGSNATNLTVSQVTVVPTSYLAYAAVTLQGVALPMFTTTGVSACFTRAVASATGIVDSAINIRAPSAGAAGVVVPLWVYAMTVPILGVYQTDLGKLGTPAGAAAVAAQTTPCGINPQGLLLNAQPTVAAYLDVKVTLTGAAAADNVAVVAALSRTTPYVLAMRAQGLPSTAAAQISTPAAFSVAAPTSAAISRAMGAASTAAFAAMCALVAL